MELFGVPTDSHLPGNLAFTEWLAGIFPHHIAELGVPDQASDPMSAYRYVKGRRDVITAASRQRPLVRLRDKNMDPIADLTGELSMAVEELMSDSGQMNCALTASSYLMDHVVNNTKIHEDLHIVVDPIPSAPDWRTRWGGKVTGINVSHKADGTKTLEFQAISNREHSKHLLFGAAPYFPPEFQLPRMWTMPGPTRSVLAMSMFINLARIHMPGFSTLTNIFNPAAWINPLSPDAIFNLTPLNWPLQIAYVNPLLDQSRWTVLGAQWTDWHSSMADMLKDSGTIFRAYTWLTEDKDSPHTELTAAIDMAQIIPDVGQSTAEMLDSLTRPTRNCVVFSLEDKSGRAGPTGTAFDGLASVFAVTLDDMISEVLVDGNTGQTLNGQPLVDVNGTTPIFASMLGVESQRPGAIWWEGQYSGILESNHRLHKAPEKTTMVGSKSPAVVNQAQTFGIKYGLAQLSEQINYAFGLDASATPSNLGLVTPTTPGLEELYQGQLDNVLLAWQRYTDPSRALWTGDMGFNEHLERGGSGTAYTMSAIQDLRKGNFKTRAFHGFTTKVINGRPWMVDVDVALGDRCGFEQDGVIYVDQITAVKREWDRTKPVTVSMSIGDDSDREDPAERGMRVLQSVWSMVAAVAGQGTLFG
ncbi:MAG: hypothetical protein WCO97_03025 [bacterium]